MNRELLKEEGRGPPAPAISLACPARLPFSWLVERVCVHVCVQAAGGGSVSPPLAPGGQAMSLRAPGRQWGPETKQERAQWAEKESQTAVGPRCGEPEGGPSLPPSSLSASPPEPLGPAQLGFPPQSLWRAAGSGQSPSFPPVSELSVLLLSCEHGTGPPSHQEWVLWESGQRERSEGKS